MTALVGLERRVLLQLRWHPQHRMSVQALAGELGQQEALIWASLGKLRASGLVERPMWHVYALTPSGEQHIF